MIATYVDFNALTESGRIRLDTAGSIEDLAKNPVRDGDWVWLSDGELRVGGQIEHRDDDWLARPIWETLEDKSSADRMGQPELQAGLIQLRQLFGTAERDYRKIVSLLPVVERVEPTRGYAAYCRSRAMKALGYPALAVLAIGEALEVNSKYPFFIHQRLTLIRESDPGLALAEAKKMVASRDAPAIVLVACIQVFADEARRAGSTREAENYDHEVISLTSRFEAAASGEPVPASSKALALVLQGFSYSRLGKKDEAVVAFSKAIGTDPSNAAAWTCRGMETYPAARAIQDLNKAVELGILSFWPYHLLAHAKLAVHDWQAAIQHSEAALRFLPPAAIRAHLYEWSGIANAELGDLVNATKCLERAVQFAPDEAEIRHNLELVKEVRSSSPVSWTIGSDLRAKASELESSLAA
jgi:tetratricopeptide (TPR) repeat protein